MQRHAHRFSALLAAALLTAVLGSALQTHLNLAELAPWGIQVPGSTRAWTTLEDVASFGPVMTGIAVAALVPAMWVGHLVTRLAPAWRATILTAAGFAGLWFAFWLMRSVIPMPPIAATREPGGHLGMALCGALGGLLYAGLTSPGRAQKGSTYRHHLLASAVLVAAPVSSFFAMAPRADSPPVQVDPNSYQVQTVIDGLDRPWSVAFLPDGRMLVTEMKGRLLAVSPNGTSTAISLDGIPTVYQDRGVIGLMEVALDPQYPLNGFIYLTMGYRDQGLMGMHLVRARLAGDRIADVRILFRSTPKPGPGNNGGRLAFLPDGTLVLTVGDGNVRREEAQNIGNTLGTVVRLDRDGQPPRDNPFITRTGAAPEVYSLGHRNPQGIAVDPRTGELFVTEHGPRGGDEFNRIEPGANHGWPIVTAGIDYPFARVSPFRHLPGFAAPMLAWTPSIAPAGLAIYQGPLFPDWQGDLLVPALKERAIRRLVREKSQIVRQELLLAELNARMRDVKVGPDGAIYVLTDGPDGKLLRLVPSATH